jgi:hypothetical protein
LAQGAKGPGHIGCVQETLLGHLLLEAGDRILVGEGAQQTGFGEIGVGVEECRGLDGLVTPRCVAGQRDCIRRLRGDDRARDRA